MQKIFLVLFLTTFTAVAQAAVYTNQQIASLINNAVVVADNQEFIRKFFIAKNPQAYIENHIETHQSATASILLEHNLYSLLNEVSYQAKQQYLQDFIFSMQNYAIQSFKTHAEGNMQVPVYNLAAKARGIENIWLAAESLNFYNKSFAKDSLVTLVNLKKQLVNLSMPQWLGLKNSISKISIKNHIIITNYLLKDPKNMQGLDKFISHYALLTGNKELASSAVLSLDKSNSEYLLRQLTNYFAPEFVIKQLTYTVEQHKNQKFAISMLAPFVDDKFAVNEFLLQNFANKDLSSSIAFALAKSNNQKTLNKLASIYQRTNSEYLQKQIKFSLQINQNYKAKNTLKTLTGALK